MTYSYFTKLFYSAVAEGCCPGHFLQVPVDTRPMKALSSNVDCNPTMIGRNTVKVKPFKKPASMKIVDSGF